MAYIVVKTIKGRQYRYLQRTHRQGGRVRTETVNLGPVDGASRRRGLVRRVADLVHANQGARHGLPDEEAMARQCNDCVGRAPRERDTFLSELRDQYGLRVDTDRHTESKLPQEEAPSGEGA
jgi:hypothetical protein